MHRIASLATASLVISLVTAGCGSQSGTGEVTAPATATPSESTAAPAPALAPATVPASPSEVKTARFASKALGVTKQYYVYLPKGYATSGKRYPVVYMLHGLGGSESNWPMYFGMKDSADKVGLEAIVVMPDGDDSFYSNNAESIPYDACLASKRLAQRAKDLRTYCVKTPRYEDYISADLVAHVDTTYRTIASREARAIGGLSMGGYGALMLAMRHQDTFGAVASHAGVASLLYRGPDPYVKGKAQIADDPKPWLARAGRFGVIFKRAFGTDIANWRAYDPSVLASKLADGKLAIYLDCGTKDEFKLHNGNQHLHDVLDGAGVKHQFHLVPDGRHNTPYWRTRLPHSLAFFKDFFARAR